MPELTAVLKLWERMEAAGETAVLATVVKTQGSSYRVPGARLLLSQGGDHAGTISGGCLEEEILKRSWWMTENGPILRRYETSQDGETEGDGYGLGCNGTIDILVQRVTPSPHTDLSLIRAVAKLRIPAVIAHVIHPAEHVGERLTIDTHGEVQTNIADSCLAASLRESAVACLAGSSSCHIRIGSDIEAFVERLVPPTHLVVFGAGDDAIPLTQIAHYLGWKVSVLDGRAHYAKAAKFPNVDSVRIRELGEPAPPVDEWTAGVLMTHSYSQDLDILRAVSAEPWRYLGLLGPRKRSDQLLEDAQLKTRNTAALHMPVGLDIGADGPEQVALSVAAEIQSVLNGRSGGFLRDREGSIHSNNSAAANESNWVRSIVCA